MALTRSINLFVKICPSTHTPQAPNILINTIFGLNDSAKAATSPPIYAPRHQDINIFRATIVEEKFFGENFVAADNKTGIVRSSLNANKT